MKERIAVISFIFSLVFLCTLLWSCSQQLMDKLEAQEHNRTTTFNSALRKEAQMGSGFGYSASRDISKRYYGGTSSGPGWELAWRSEIAPEGPLPIDVVKAAIDNLQHKQSAGVGSNEDAKLLFDLQKAVDFYEGKPDLNDLIPEVRNAPTNKEDDTSSN